jgi:hypothetical protein
MPSVPHRVRFRGLEIAPLSYADQLRDKIRSIITGRHSACIATTSDLRANPGCLSGDLRRRVRPMGAVSTRGSVWPKPVAAHHARMPA